MATADQVRALVRAHYEGDDERFHVTCRQIIANAQSNGKGAVAQSLEQAMKEGLRKSPKAQVLTFSPELKECVLVTDPVVGFSDIILSEKNREVLLTVVKEFARREELRAHDLRPSRRVLLLGPPGTGKTMSASILAKATGLPLYTILLSGVVSSYLGATASKLAKIFDGITKHPAVWLFDEFDALASDRGNDRDVGEMRRVVNSLLQFLDQCDVDYPIVAASNYDSILDKAVYRRFDTVLRYGLPIDNERASLLQMQVNGVTFDSVDWSEISRLTNGMSHADVVKVRNVALKIAILAGKKVVFDGDLRQAISHLTS